jgi:hypothetical protein
MGVRSIQNEGFISHRFDGHISYSRVSKVQRDQHTPLVLHKLK